MGEQFSVLVNLANINNSIVVFVDELQQNVTDIVDFTHEFKTNITNLLGRIEKIKDNLENSLIKYVNDFEKVMYCTFIADGFFNIYDAICVHMAPSITMIGLMLLGVGILLIPVNTTLIIGVKRLKARRFGPVMASDAKFTDVKLARKRLRTKIDSEQFSTP
ncbi:putative 2-oxoglutarate dehydrogenase E1 component [Phytophthora cinnamomi]|uniref:putative 2-oxoglutarate dehydrogenase E1 component n=1 Tax=Phytophthora cinnamomi TaxID=4785 RepID=UPI0035594720|nr:putative 2-oxoglutarate dehydrogenase E1 component [Phytophthora cinnamomi]